MVLLKGHRCFALEQWRRLIQRLLRQHRMIVADGILRVNSDVKGAQGDVLKSTGKKTGGIELMTKVARQLDEITTHIDETLRRRYAKRFFEIRVSQVQVAAVEVRGQIICEGLIPLLEHRIERLAMPFDGRSVPRLTGGVGLERFVRRSVRSCHTLGVAMIDDVSIGESRAEQRFAVFFDSENTVERTILALTVEIRAEKITVRHVQSTSVVLARGAHAAMWIVLLDERQDDRQPFHVPAANQFATGRRNRIGMRLIVDRRQTSVVVDQNG